MSEERMNILRMLEEGKISAKEAAELIEALGEGSEEEPRGSPKAKWLRVRVTCGDEEKVKVNLPLSLAKMAWKFVPDAARQKLHLHGVDLDIENLDEIMEEVQRHGTFKLVDVVSDNGEKVEVFVE